MHELTNKTNCVSDIMLCDSKINGFTNKMLILIDENKRKKLTVKLSSESVWKCDNSYFLKCFLLENKSK